MRSICVEKGDQALVLLPGTTRVRFASNTAEGHRLGLHLDIDFGIDVAGIDRRMAKPRADRVDIHTGKHQMEGGRAPVHYLAQDIVSKRRRAKP